MEQLIKFLNLCKNVSKCSSIFFYSTASNRLILFTCYLPLFSYYTDRHICVGLYLIILIKEFFLLVFDSPSYFVGKYIACTLYLTPGLYLSSSAPSTTCSRYYCTLWPYMSSLVVGNNVVLLPCNVASTCLTVLLGIVLRDNLSITFFIDLFLSLGLYISNLSRISYFFVDCIDITL